MEFIGSRQLELFLAYQNDMCIAVGVAEGTEYLRGNATL